MNEPTYRDFFIESYHYFVRNIIKSEHFRAKFNNDLRIMARQVTITDLAVITILTVLLTIGRHFASKYIFIPIAKWRGIAYAEAEKIPESAWKLFFYLATWTSTTYYLFFYQNTQYFTLPAKVWDGYSIDAPVGRFIYAIYTIELSFYIHSLYTTIQVDQRRKDTYTLMFHHLICIVMISVSYCNKSHKSGLLTLFLHDGSDVLLEATKLVRYFKVQHGHVYHRVEVLVNIGFGCFLLTWVSNRLYWFPIKQVYMASIYVEQKRIPVPFIVPLVVMLWLVLVMNFYWFSFALRLLYKVATGQIQELEDNREYGEENCPKDERRKNSVDSGVVVSDTELEAMEFDLQNTGYNLRKRKK